MDVVVRTLREDEVEPAFLVLEQVFSNTPHADDIRVELSVVDPGRFYGAWTDDRIIGTAGSFDFLMTVPGARIPVAGVTWVSVLPPYRRRGVLTAMMTRQLADLHESGTAVAALWASEAAIYGRYGYATAAWHLRLDVVRGAAFHAPVPAGRMRLVEPSAPQVREVYERVAAVTPGWPARDDRWWGFRVHDPEHRRQGASPLQCVATDGGYALYSCTLSWQDGLAAGKVEVREVVAATPEARARLWRYLLDLDLVKHVEVAATGVDEPLVHDLLAEPRAARAALRDCLHVRLVDVATALSARRYAADVDVVLEVQDRHCPWNTGSWRLVGGVDGADCSPTSAPADLVVSVADLGAAYLGGTPLRSRAVTERTAGALRRTSTAFGPLEAAPWCPQVF